MHDVIISLIAYHCSVSSATTILHSYLLTVAMESANQNHTVNMEKQRWRRNKVLIGTTPSITVYLTWLTSNERTVTHLLMTKTALQLRVAGSNSSVTESQLCTNALQLRGTIEQWQNMTCHVINDVVYKLFNGPHKNINLHIN